MKSAYLFDISRTTDAAALHEFRHNAENDWDLSMSEREEISAAIDARFGALNLAAHGEQKPRW